MMKFKTKVTCFRHLLMIMLPSEIDRTIHSQVKRSNSSQHQLPKKREQRKKKEKEIILLRKRSIIKNFPQNFTLTVVDKFIPPPRNFTQVSWTGPLGRRPYQNEFLGRVKFRGRGINLSTTVRLFFIFRSKKGYLHCIFY